MMYLAFQKRSSGIFERLICWWTKGPYFHVAMLFTDTPGVDHYHAFEALAGTGTHELYCNKLDPEHWDLVSLPTDHIGEERIKKWLASELHCPYDWFGLFMAQVLGINRESNSKWFCSEYAVAAAQQDDLFKGFVPCSISPNHLYKMAMDLPGSTVTKKYLPS